MIVVLLLVCLFQIGHTSIGTSGISEIASSLGLRLAPPPPKGKFQIVEVFDSKIGKLIAADKTARIAFKSGGKFTGFSGCNTFSGKASIAARGRFRVQGFTTTEIGCLKTTESQLYQSLRSAVRYIKRGQVVKLTNGVGKTVVILRKASPKPPSCTTSFKCHSGVTNPWICGTRRFDSLCEVKQACIDENTCKPGPGECAAIAVFDPVCCNGVQQGNSGQASCNGFTGCTKGPCGAGGGSLGTALLGPKWVLQFYHKGSTKTIAKGVFGVANITFSKGTTANSGRLTGGSGCNILVGGGYKLAAPNKLQIGPIGLTRRGCGPGAQPPEFVFVRALESATTYKVSGTKLTINTRAGEVLVFQAE